MCYTRGFYLLINFFVYLWIFYMIFHMMFFIIAPKWTDFSPGREASFEPSGRFLTTNEGSKILPVTVQPM